MALNFEIRVLVDGEWMGCARWPRRGWDDARQKAFGRAVPHFGTRDEARKAIAHMRTVEGDTQHLGIADLTTGAVEDVP